jgi:hypothetical protein
MPTTLSVCPVCSGSMQVTELECVQCKATVRSRFDSCRFCRLSQEHLGFIELFLRCEGNLSRVEKELNLSYPTVRNRLSAAVAALGPDEAPAEAPVDLSDTDTMARRRTLLDELARGVITADDVADALKRMS